MDSSDAAPRRSKRDHQPSAKAAASSASDLLTHALSGASGRVQRRRIPSTAPSGPQSLAVPCPVSAPLVDPSGSNDQRRQFRTDLYTSGTSSVYQRGVQSTYSNGNHRSSKLLGRYSSRDCATLCEVILSQLQKQTLASTVLDEPKSPACIRWEAVAATLKTTHGLWITPRECQVLWKFLAYGQVVESKAGPELLPDSDEEEFGQSPEQSNARLAADRAKAAAKDQATVNSQDAMAGKGTTGKSRDYRSSSGNTEARSTQSITCEATAEQKSDRNSIKLYPTYSLPTGAPDAWYRPFGTKDALPLTFVASRFLRRKPTPVPAPSRVEQLTIRPGPGATATATAELKRKQADNQVEAAKKAKFDA